MNLDPNTSISTQSPAANSPPTSWGVKMREFCGKAWKAFADLPKSLSSLAEKIGLFFQTIWNEYEEDAFSGKQPSSAPVFKAVHIPPSHPATQSQQSDSVPISSTPPEENSSTSSNSVPVGQNTSILPAHPAQLISPSSSALSNLPHKITDLTASFFPSPASSSTGPFTLINVNDDGSCYYYSVIAGIVRSNNKEFWDHFTNILRKTQENLPDNIKKDLSPTVDFQKISFSDWVNQVKKEGISFDQDLSRHADHLKPIVLLLRHAIANFIEENLNKQDVLGGEVRARLDTAISDDSQFSKVIPKKPENGRYIELDRTLAQAMDIYPQHKQIIEQLRIQIPGDTVILSPSLTQKREFSQFFLRTDLPDDLADFLGMPKDHLDQIVALLKPMVEKQKQDETEYEKQRLEKMQTVRKNFLTKMKHSDQWANDLQTAILPFLFVREATPLLGVRIWGPNGTVKSADLKPLGSTPESDSIQIDIYHANSHYQVVDSTQDSFKKILHNAQEQEKLRGEQASTKTNREFETFYNKNIQPLVSLVTNYDTEISVLLSQVSRALKVDRSQTPREGMAPKPSASSTPASKFMQQIQSVMKIVPNLIEKNPSNKSELDEINTKLNLLLQQVKSNKENLQKIYSSFLDNLQILSAMYNVNTEAFPKIPELVQKKKQLPSGAIPTPSDGSCAIYALCLSALANEKAQELLKQEHSFQKLIDKKSDLLKNGVSDLSSHSMKNLVEVSQNLRKKLTKNLQTIVAKPESDRSDKEKEQIINMRIAAEETLLSDDKRKDIIKTWLGKETELSVLDASLEKINKKKATINILSGRFETLSKKLKQVKKESVKKSFQDAINKIQSSLSEVLQEKISQEKIEESCKNAVNKTEDTINDLVKRRKTLLEDSSYKKAHNNFTDMCKRSGYPDPERLETGYVQTIASPSSYLDHIAIEELSNLLNIRIQVFQRNTNATQVDSLVTYNPDQEKWPVVSMFFEDGHYSAYIPPAPIPPH